MWYYEYDIDFHCISDWLNCDNSNEANDEVEAELELLSEAILQDDDFINRFQQATVA